MPTATITLPRLLEPAVGSVRTVLANGATMAELIADLLTQHPTLAVHLFDETGRLRPHVLCFHNGTMDRDLGDAPVGEGDQVLFLQAVSGG